MNPRIILATTDLSARSDRAIDRALSLGRDLGMAVHVMHAVEDEKSDLADDPALLEQAVRTALPDPGADLPVITRSGSAPDAIAEVADELDAAIIVTGIARFNSLGDYFVGTAVEKISGHSRRPVLVVKQRPHQPYRRIACAVDFSNHSANALTTALRLFPDCRVLALHAYHVAFEGWQRDEHVREETSAMARKEFDAFLDGLPLSAEERHRLDSRIGYGDVGQVLREEVNGGGVDLVVLGTHGMGGLRQATIGSIASSLLQGVVADTLVVPPE